MNPDKGSKVEYLVVIEKVQNNYSAYAPEVPGCVTTGTTVEQTRNHMKEALEFHLEGMLSDQEPLPESRGMEAYRQALEDSQGVECYYCHLEIELDKLRETVAVPA